LEGHLDKTLCGVSSELLLITASEDQTVKVWNLELGGECLKTFDVISDRILMLCFSGDQERVAAGQESGRILILNVYDE